jgi:HAE1 family hydrophobic/amphiphilic exporter-1
VGVLPLVLPTGAGAKADISLGLSVLSGIIASTCLAVLFVPSFFTVLQGLDERRKRKEPAHTEENIDYEKAQTVGGRS